MADMREWLNEHTGLLTGGAVVLMIFAVGILVRQLTSSPFASNISEVYYYDLGKNTTGVAALIGGRRADSPPIPSPTDKSKFAVGVYVFACGKCTASSRQIGFLEMYTKAAKDLIEKVNTNSDRLGAHNVMGDDIEAGRLVSKETPVSWVPAMSRQGQIIQGDPQTKCSGNMPTACYP